MLNSFMRSENGNWGIVNRAISYHGTPRKGVGGGGGRGEGEAHVHRNTGAGLNNLTGIY